MIFRASFRFFAMISFLKYWDSMESKPFFDQPRRFLDSDNNSSPTYRATFHFSFGARSLSYFKSGSCPIDFWKATIGSTSSGNSVFSIFTFINFFLLTKAKISIQFCWWCYLKTQIWQFDPLFHRNPHQKLSKCLVSLRHKLLYICNTKFHQFLDVNFFIDLHDIPSKNEFIRMIFVLSDFCNPRRTVPTRPLTAKNWPQGKQWKCWSHLFLEFITSQNIPGLQTKADGGCRTIYAEEQLSSKELKLASHFHARDSLANSVQVISLDRDDAYTCWYYDFSIKIQNANFVESGCRLYFIWLP